MKRFFNLFKDSALELTGKGKITCVVMTALLIALSMCIEAFTIEIPNIAKINFAYIAIAAIGMLYGPTIGFFAGGICDILGYMVHPDGAFLPLYTLIGMLQGLIYGIVLYRKWGDMNPKGKGKEKKIPEFAIRIIIARLLDVVIINLFMNTAANIHYGFIPKQAYGAAIIARIAKNAFLLCADLPLLMIVLPVILGAYLKIFGKRKATA